MAEKKPTKKAVKQAAPIKVLSDKEIVLTKYPEAESQPIKNGFVIFDGEISLHSGICKSESDAWKLAAHSVL